jgi:hypothetical protein
MKIPAEVQPASWRAVGGAAVAIAIGFIWGGWVTGSTSEARAVNRAETAVVAVLIPICVENFRRSPDAAANLASLTEAKSWDRHTFIEKGGWATAAGSTEPYQAVARACAAELVS